MTGTEHREDGWDRSLSRRRLLAGAAAVAAAGALPLSLDAASAFAATPRKGGRLRVAINDGGSTDLLTPYNLPNWASAARAEAAYERLFKVDPFGVPRPRLALSLEPNKLGTIWRCKLRQGVTFHSGKKFTAEDVLYSYRYIADPKNKAEGQPRVSQIDLKNSKAIGPYEIEFRLKAPIGDFASTVSDKAIWIAPTGQDRLRQEAGRHRAVPVRAMAARRELAVQALRELLGARTRRRPVRGRARVPDDRRRQRPAERPARRPGRRDGVHLVPAGQEPGEQQGDQGDQGRSGQLLADHDAGRLVALQVERRARRDEARPRSRAADQERDARVRVGRQRPLRQGPAELQLGAAAAEVRPREGREPAQEGRRRASST